MAGRATQRWAKFPSFVQYANESQRFRRKTPASITWAGNLSSSFALSYGGTLWSDEEAWNTLRDHQPVFRSFLACIIAAQDTPASLTWESMQTLTEHCLHVQLESRWDGRPEKVRQRAAQRYTDESPAMVAAVRSRLVAQGVPESELPLVTLTPRRPPDRYHETWTPQDPLDALYWDLREFLRRGKPERLHRCPTCGRYFVQMTARTQTYCDAPCRIKANPTRRAHNAEYQRRHREGKIRDDLRKVRAAKGRLRTAGVETLKLEWVLEEAGVTKRRWTSLRKWETTQYGEPRATDLTKR